jgi:hypothetical protein
VSSRPPRKPKPPPVPLQDPDWLAAAGSDEERLRLLHFVQQDPHGHGVSIEDRWKAVLVALEMRAKVESGQGELVLEVRCSSDYRGRRCGQPVAWVWAMDDGGHYIRWQVRTGPYRRLAVLNQAMDQQADGMPNIAKATEQYVEEEVVKSDACLEAPSMTEGLFLLMCSRHGHACVDQLLLYGEAKSTRTVLGIDFAGALPAT